MVSQMTRGMAMTQSHSMVRCVGLWLQYLEEREDEEMRETDCEVERFVGEPFAAFALGDSVVGEGVAVDSLEGDFEGDAPSSGVGKVFGWLRVDTILVYRLFLTCICFGMTQLDGYNIVQIEFQRAKV